MFNSQVVATAPDKEVFNLRSFDCNFIYNTLTESVFLVHRHRLFLPPHSSTSGYLENELTNHRLTAQAQVPRVHVPNQG